MQHRDPSPPEARETGGHERAPDEQSAGLASHVEDHHFAHPTVAPVSRPAPDATSQW